MELITLLKEYVTTLKRFFELNLIHKIFKEKIMKKLMLTILFLSLSTLAFSGYKDVVKMKLSDGCSMQDIVELKDNFNSIM